MATDVRCTIEIPRPRVEVAAYMFDPRNDARWTTGVVACRPLTDGPLRPGSRVERVTRFLGRRFAYTYEVTDADPDGDRFVELRVTEPFPMQIRYELDDAPDGTRAAIHARGDATGFYRLAAPLLNRMVRRNIARDLAALRAALAR